MEDDFLKNLVTRRKKDEIKDIEYKQASKDRLTKICITKIKTTMIGALESIEKRLSSLWVPVGDKPTNEQLILRRLFDEMRQEILDRGNAQIRNLETELEQYEIEWKRYTLQLPVKVKE